MGNRYSKEELGSIEPLILEGLTNREIASRLGRSEAGLRNVRYRHKLKRKTEDSIRHLHLQKEKVESEIDELKQTKTHLIDELRPLEEKKNGYENLLTADMESIKDFIEDNLIELKIEKPELFSITGEEQIAIFVGSILKRLIS